MGMLSIIVLFVGLCSFTLAVGLGVRFALSGWAVGVALAMEKGVDAIASGATVIFNTNALATGSNDMDMYVAHGLRLAIFVPSIAASLHLHYKTTALARMRDDAIIGNRFRNDFKGMNQAQLLDEMEAVVALMQRKRKTRNRNG